MAPWARSRPIHSPARRPSRLGSSLTPPKVSLHFRARSPEPHGTDVRNGRGHRGRSTFPRAADQPPRATDKMWLIHPVRGNSSPRPLSSPLPQQMRTSTSHPFGYHTRRPRTRLLLLQARKDSRRPPLRIPQRQRVGLEHLGEAKQVVHGRASRASTPSRRASVDFLRVDFSVGGLSSSLRPIDK